MNHVIYQTASLLRFLNSINLTKNNLNYNKLDTDISFVSRYYTPNLKISELSKKMLDEIQNGNIKTSEYDYNKNSIVSKIQNSSLKTNAPSVYSLCQTIILEAYSIVNCFLENPDYLKYLTNQDIMVSRENLNYVADYMSEYEEYNSIILDLRDLDICFGYIENQLPLIKGGIDNEV